MRNLTVLSTLCLTLAIFNANVSAKELVVQKKSAEKVKAYIISPLDGETVSQTFTVRFGLSGMGVAPAGIDKPGTGHHHLLIDSKALPAAGIPMGSNVKHFGGGQTETQLSLNKGTHTLQLILGDKFHIPHSPMIVSEKIKIIVE